MIPFLVLPGVAAPGFVFKERLLMLSVSNISKIFGDKTVLHNISFSVKAEQHVALVGPNGSGKTTLLRIMVGKEKADTGAIRLNPTSATIGYLPQGLVFSETETIGDYLTRTTSTSPNSASV